MGWIFCPKVYVSPSNFITPPSSLFRNLSFNFFSKSTENTWGMEEKINHHPKIAHVFMYFSLPSAAVKGCSIWLTGFKSDLPFTSCGALGKWPNPSAPQLPYLPNGDNSAYLIGLWHVVTQWGKAIMRNAYLCINGIKQWVCIYLYYILHAFLQCSYKLSVNIIF